MGASSGLQAAVLATVLLVSATSVRAATSAAVRIVADPGNPSSVTLAEQAVVGQTSSSFTFTRVTTGKSGKGCATGKAPEDVRAEGELHLLQDDVPVARVRQHRLEAQALRVDGHLEVGACQAASELPVCDATRRGQVRLAVSAAHDQPDDMMACLYAGGGSWAWTPLAYRGVSAGSASCGNGIVEVGEECDRGQWNSDTAPDACRKNCKRASCGDGVVDAGEQCEPSETALCSGLHCTLLHNVSSCKAVLVADPTAADGFYDVNILGTVTRVHCLLAASTEGGPGWTSVVDVARGVKPALTLVGPSSGGYDAAALYLDNTASVDRGGNGYSKARITVPVPAMTQVRVHFGHGEQCYRPHGNAGNMVSHDWGSTQDWMPTSGAWVMKADGTPNGCSYFGSSGDRKGVYIGSLAKAATSSVTIEFGAECGTNQCSYTPGVNGARSQYESVYVR